MNAFNLQFQILKTQFDLTALLLAGDFGTLHPRYPTGTMKDGKNVGGKFMEKGDSGSEKSADTPSKSDPNPILKAIAQEVSELWEGVNQRVSDAVAAAKTVEQAGEKELNALFKSKDLKKIAGIALTVGIFAVATLGPEIALSLALGQAISATSLGAALFAGGAGIAIDKGLEKLNVKDPKIRFAASLVSSILLSYGAANVFRRLRVLPILKHPALGKAYECSANPNQLARLEMFTRNAKNERAVLIDRDGKVIQSAIGESNNVFINEEDRLLMGSTLTHNHPPQPDGKPYTLSGGDLVAAINGGIDEFRAVSEKTIFVLSRKKTFDSKAFASLDDVQKNKIFDRNTSSAQRLEKRLKKDRDKFMSFHAEKIGRKMQDLAETGVTVTPKKFDALFHDWMLELNRLQSFSVMQNLEKYDPEFEYKEFIANPSQILKSVNQELKDLEKKLIADLKAANISDSGIA